MRAGGAPVAALLLISTSLVIQVTSEDLYWEGEEDASNEFLEVKEQDSSLLGHLSRIKRDWSLWDVFSTSSSTTPEPDNTEDTTADPAGGPLPFDDEAGDGSGAHIVGDPEPKEKTLRVTFVAMQPYQEEYSNRDSPQFQNFSKSLANAVNKIYEEQGRNREISGTQRASLVRIQSRTSDDFSCKVTLDIVTTGYYDMDKITEILRKHIQGRRSLEGVVVSDLDFSANVIDPASADSCPDGWFRCDAGACLPFSARCNGQAECSDGTDETGCPPDTENMIPEQGQEEEFPPFNTERSIPAEPEDTGESSINRECHPDELQCDYTRCVSLTKRCDGHSDCDDNSDEQNCTPIEGERTVPMGCVAGGSPVPSVRGSSPPKKETTMWSHRSIEMEKSSFKSLRAGLQEEESRPSASAGGCPTVSGGGKSCFVDRCDAGLREHDPGYPVLDIDYAEVLRLRGGIGDKADRKSAQARGTDDGAVEMGAPMARTTTHSPSEKKEAFCPRSTLARSPVLGEGSSPRIDLNAAAIQIAPRGRKECLAEKAPRSHQLVTGSAERDEAPKERRALAPVQEDGREARAEKIPVVILTRLDDGSAAHWELRQDADGARQTTQPASPVAAATGTGVGADLEGAASQPTEPTKAKTRCRKWARPNLPTPFKFGGQAGERKSSVDSPIPWSDAEDSRLSGPESSEASMRTVASKKSSTRGGKLWRRSEKRPADELADELALSSSESDGRAISGDTASENVRCFLKPTSKRGRGKSSATGEYVRIGKYPVEICAERAREKQLLLEDELAAYNLAVEAAAKVKQDILLNRQLQDDRQISAQTSAAIAAETEEALKIAEKVVDKSGNLKGTSVKALKGVIATVRKNFAEIRSLTVTEEVARLEAANTKLSWQLTELRKEVAQMRGQPAAVTESEMRRLIEEVSRSNREQFCTMLNARLEGIECRLLPEPHMRPPLAADRQVETRSDSKLPCQQQAEKAGPAQSYPIDGQRRLVDAGSTPASEKPNKRRRNKTSLAAKEAMAARQVPRETSVPTTASNLSAANAGALATREPRPVPPAPPTTNRQSNWMAGSKAKSKTAALPNAQSQPTARPKLVRRKLRPPRSAAVVLTLQPDAVEKGVTYAKVLSDAKEKVKLKDLGIDTLHFRRAITGARILELPGTTSSEKADKLAKELAEKLGEVVRVSRPTKCAELRLSNLDDSVTPTEVVAALAQTGGCAEDQIRTGEIRPDHTGLGTLWVRCPVTAAKKVAEGGRLLVGWSSAQVKILESRTVRCFRCLESGHVRAQCHAQTDRSDLCYRCSQPGHKSAQCTAAPHCVLCKTAGKLADHVLSSKLCSAPRPRRIKSADDGPRASSQRSQPASTTPEARSELVEEMALG